MIGKIVSTIACILMLTNIIGFHQELILTSNPKTYPVVNLTPTWTTGDISYGVGSAKIIVSDLNQNFITDIASCSNGHAYVLNHNASDDYDVSWYSERLGCLRIASADRDFNNILELYIGTDSGRVVIFDSNTYNLLGDFSLPVGVVIRDIDVADVDGDNALEIVVVSSGNNLPSGENVINDTFVYDANTFLLEWRAAGMGGTQVNIGNIDTDPLPEIIVNSNPAHVLNASTKTQKWAYSGGFGKQMGLGDVDGDHIKEIASFFDSGDLSVFDGDKQTIKWQFKSTWCDSILVADVDGDAIDEVIAGDNQWGYLKGYRGADGTMLWSIKNPSHGVSGIGVGDANNDGMKEIVWGAGISSSGPKALIVGNWETQSVEWISTDLDGPFYVAAGDLDLDGKEEVVMTSKTSGNGYYAGEVRVYDWATHKLKNSYATGGVFDILQFAVGQVDNDPALEIILGGRFFYTGGIKTYDGANQTNEWVNMGLGGYPIAMTVKNIDSDSIDEIIVGLGNYHVLVFNGASNLIQWDSGELDGPIQDIDVGDINGDSVLDMAILTNQSLWIYRVDTWALERNHPVLGGYRLATANADQTSSGEVIISTTITNLFDDRTKNTLFALDGVKFNTLWFYSLNNAIVNDIVVNDLDEDGIQDIVFGGLKDVLDPHYPGFVWIACPDSPFFWEYRSINDWGAVNSMTVVDVDNEGQKALLFGSNNLIQINQITTADIEIRNLYLPVIKKQ